MKKSRFLPLLLLLALVISILGSVQAFAVEGPQLDSKSVMLADAKTGNVLFSKNESEKAYPASLTKIMTLLLAVESIERDEVALSNSVTAGGNIAFDLVEGGSSSGIVSGETMTLESYLYCAMLGSANEACNVIAETIGGSVSNFVDLMNKRAEELGCSGTHFANTHGLPNTNHYSTASDFLLIAKEAISHPLFMQICNTVTYTVPATNKAGERKLSNINGLINDESTMYPGYLYEGAAGVKTGHTDDAGYCLVSTASKDKVNLLCVVMGGVANNINDGMEYSNFTDSVKLYNWGFENFSYRDIIATTDLIDEVPVKMGSDSNIVTLRPREPVTALLANDDNFENFEQHIVIYNEESREELVAPVEAGQVLGEITISKDGKVYGKAPLVASTSVDLSHSQYMKSRIVATLKKPLVIIFILVILGLAVGYVYLVVRYRRSKRKYYEELQRRRENAQFQPEPQRERKQPVMANLRDINIPVEKPSTGLDSNSSGEAPAERDYFEEFFGKK